MLVTTRLQHGNSITFTREKGQRLPFFETLASEPRGLDMPDAARWGPKLS